MTINSVVPTRANLRPRRSQISPTNTWPMIAPSTRAKIRDLSKQFYVGIRTDKQGVGHSGRDIRSVILGIELLEDDLCGSVSSSGRRIICRPASNLH